MLKTSLGSTAESLFVVTIATTKDATGYILLTLEKLGSKTYKVIAMCFFSSFYNDIYIYRIPLLFSHKTLHCTYMNLKNITEEHLLVQCEDNMSQCDILLGC